MQIGVIGLGRMGGNIARRLMRGGHDVVGFDQNTAATSALADEGIAVTRSLDELAARLQEPRIFWIMLPAGPMTESTIEALIPLAAPGDIFIDGGNSFYKDDIRRARACALQHLHYVDVGTSGGVWGLERGYCMMIGGEKDVVERLDPIFETLAPGHGELLRTPGRSGPVKPSERGYIHAGPAGAGHFVKMVHNGIEYGLMQAYAEGYELLEAKGLITDVPGTLKAWSRGTVVRSWLLDLLVAALEEDQDLSTIEDWVDDSGEGRWTVDEAIDLAVPLPVISAALFARFASRQGQSPAMKAVAALRQQFGGHAVRPAGTAPSEGRIGPSAPPAPPASSV